MAKIDLFAYLGIEKPVDVFRNSNGSLKVITNYDLELYRRGYIANPYIN